MRYIVFFLSILSILACNAGSTAMKSDKKYLEKYFYTNDITLNYEKAHIEIIVKNSPLIKREQEKKENKWETLEAFCSMGAFIASGNTDNKPDNSTDSIKVKMYSSKDDFEEYSYKLKDVKKSGIYLDKIVSFCKLVGEGQYSKARNLLADDAFNNTTTQEIDTILSKMFAKKKVNDVLIIACKFYDDMAGLYINAKYGNDEVITYLFSFRLEGNGKIAGISLP